MFLADVPPALFDAFVAVVAVGLATVFVRRRREIANAQQVMMRAGAGRDVSDSTAQAMSWFNVVIAAVIACAAILMAIVAVR